MRIKEQSGRVITHKRFNFFVSQMHYKTLQIQQKEGGFPTMSALVRELVAGRSVVVRKEPYSLDRAMRVLSPVHDILSCMLLDLQQMVACCPGALDEGAFNSVGDAGGALKDRIEQLHCFADPFINLITQLSKVW